ncbi:MAG: transcription elongation factor GreA [Clostridiales bacterium]|jgi:transcription elongation factor GreA|nr:transcription elongation factor GreA [Clostridiales bacterium]
MSSPKKYKMSRERYKEIVEELHYLQTVGEKEISEQIKEARSFGDLSENSEYDEAKTQQGKLYSKIAELQELLENAEIIEKTDMIKDAVSIGSRVRIENLDTGEESVYQIVGSHESNPLEGKISDESPVGSAIIGKRVGEDVTIQTLMGKVRYRIESVENM